MPCMDGGPSRNDDSSYRDYLRVSKLLCKACRIIAKAGLEGKMSASLAAWWSLHQKDDEERLARQKEENERKALRKQALDKLTDEERKALNLR